MQREEAVQEIKEIVDNLNMNGLKLILNLLRELSNMEKYDLNTPETRIEEIKKQDKEQSEKEQIENKKKADEEMFARMQQRVLERKEKIAALGGKEKRFYDKIRTVRNIKNNRYVMSWNQVLLISGLYNNNYKEASQDAFCYGFYQGMQYIKTEQKRENGKLCGFQHQKEVEV